MPQFNTEVAHQLGKQHATERLKLFIDGLRQRYGDQVSDIQGSWADSTLTFALTTYGFKIDGSLQVEDQRAVLSGNLPLAALPFRGKIEQTIAGELRRELA